MTKTFATERLRLNLIDWAQELSDPNAGAGTPAAIGSFWDQAGPSVPTELFLKLRAADDGWVRLDPTYNVKAFGAVGDGVTDDTAAIQAAVDACDAAGGGIVYFPPVNVAAGEYYRLIAATVLGGVTVAIALNDLHNITFLGDGFASKVEMSQNNVLVALVAFFVFNGSSHIRFENFHLSGASSVAVSSNLIYIFGGPLDLNPGWIPGTSHIAIEGMYWGNCCTTPTVGNRVILFGDVSPFLVDYVEYNYNLGDSATCAEVANINGHYDHIEGTYNWISGCASGGISLKSSTSLAAGGVYQNRMLIGNQCSANNTVSGALLLSQAGEIAWNVIAAGRRITAGFGTAGLAIQRIHVRGNILTATIVDTGIALSIGLTPIENHGHVIGNVIATFGTSFPIALFANGTVVKCNTIADNVCECPSTGSTAIIQSSRAGFFQICGNIGIHTANNASAIGISMLSVGGSAAAGDGFNTTCSGNLLMATGATTGSEGIRPNISEVNAGSMCIEYNLTRRYTQGIVFSRTTGVFTEWRACGNNNCSGATSATVTPPTTNVGVTIEGSAGPGTQFVQNAVTPVANVSAPAGSLCNNTTGVQSATVFYKESGTGVSGGTGGWFGIGAFEQVSGALLGSVATAARFFAPGGMGLAVESTVEIQWAAPRAGTIRNLRIRCTAGTGGGTNTYTVRKNGVNTTLTIGILNTATNGADITHSFTVVAGDLISVQVTKSSGAGTPQARISASFEMVS